MFGLLQTGIFHYIDQTNGFNPAIYQAYQAAADKTAFMNQLKQISRQIIHEEFGVDEARQVIDRHGKDFLVGVIQMTSPTSGASFVKRNELVGLMNKMLEAGDLRGHVPSVWRKALPPFELTQGRYDLKEGEIADPDGVKTLLSDLRVREGKDKIEETRLVDALVVYLRALKGEAKTKAREEVQKTLSALAGQNDVLREKIDRIQDNDYSALILLAQIFNDKDGVQKVLATALEKVPETEFVGKVEKKRIDSEGMKANIIRGLKGAGRLPTQEERIVQLGKILRAFDDSDIDLLLLTDPRLDEGLRTEIRQAMGEEAVIQKGTIIEQILGEPREFIEVEMAKYEYNPSASPMTIGLRAVKGPAFGLNGMTSGVCTATDMELWKNPNFKLLAIVDETNLQVVGYLHVFETKFKGRKVLTLPGINPSAEFMATVDTEALYNKMMSQVIEYAQIGGYKGVYIPTNPTIHSNRTGIQKMIQNAGYPIKGKKKKDGFPTVNWNTLPNPYPFSEVYEVWEKP